MLDDQAVTTESAPVTTDQDAAQPTEALNQGTNGQQNGGSQYVPYERFQQVNRQMREFERQNAALNQRLAQLEQRREQTGQPVSDEERAIREARDALHKLEPNLPKYDERLQSIEGAFRQLMAQQSQAHMQRAVQHVASLAKAEGLPVTKDYMQRLVKLVAAEAQMIENGDDRYKAGDLSVLDEAFAAVKAGFLSHHQRQGAAALGQTKANVRNLPPRSAVGGPAGQPAPETFDAKKDDPRSFWERTLKKGQQAIRAASEETA